MTFLWVMPELSFLAMLGLSCFWDHFPKPAGPSCILPTNHTRITGAGKQDGECPTASRLQALRILLYFCWLSVVIPPFVTSLDISFNLHLDILDLAVTANSQFHAGDFHVLHGTDWTCHNLRISVTQGSGVVYFLYNVVSAFTSIGREQEWAQGEVQIHGQHWELSFCSLVGFRLSLYQKRICMGHKAQTTHWEVLELLGICFSLCRKRKESPHLCVESGTTSLCCSHILFWGENQWLTALST